MAARKGAKTQRGKEKLEFQGSGPTLLFPFLLGVLAPLRAAVGAPPPAGPADTDQLRPIVPPMRLGDWLAEHLGWIVALGSLAALTLLAWSLWRRWKRRGVPGDPRTPRQRADERLQRLRVRSEELDARTFGNEACDILRDFLATERHLPIARQTSEEFLAAAPLGSGEHALLTYFLATCDGLKFAAADATVDVKERLLTGAADFVTGAAVHRPPPLPVISA